MSEPAASLRGLLFGDAPLDAWPPGDEVAGAPWDGFVRARRHLVDGDQDLAIREWSAIAATPGLESRHTLQAWCFLRSVGVVPDASIAGEVLGVVAEVPLDTGHDVLAAYRDGSMRYLNHGGGGSVVEPPAPDEVAAAAAHLLAVGQEVADTIGPWDQPHLPELPSDQLRFTMLTREGFRFGQGPAGPFSQSPPAARLLAAATALLEGVVALGPSGTVGS